MKDLTNEYGTSMVNWASILIPKIYNRQGPRPRIGTETRWEYVDGDRSELVCLRGGSGQYSFRFLAICKIVS